jgi:phosphoribosylglycinamide formyltransferase-1
MIRITEPGRLRLAVLASGRGSNFTAICQAIDEGRLDAEIVVVISDKKEAPVLEKARNRNIDHYHIALQDYPDKAAYELEIIKKLQAYDIQLVVLAGYMRLVGKELLETYKWKIINIHPALLPAFPGLDAQQQAVDYGVRFSGCTVHFVDDGVDSGTNLFCKESLKYCRMIPLILCPSGSCSRSTRFMRKLCSYSPKGKFILSNEKW